MLTLPEAAPVQGTAIRVGRLHLSLEIGSIMLRFPPTGAAIADVDEGKRSGRRP
jgi:hypothetical protein